ncbi:MAG TPA: LptF/LptG family permease [Pirellulales bacterium]|nr:LptF/LptG family permease [Pirellulales bacterium]
MLIIHRYLLRHFLQVFAICFCSLMGLFIVIDAFQNLEEFVRSGDTHGGVLKAVWSYYSYQTLPFFESTSAVVTLIAAMFTLANFQRFNELTALLAAGIPKWKIVKPIVIAAGLIAVAAVVNREIVMPANRDKLTRDVHDLWGEKAKEVYPHRDYSSDILIQGKQSIAKNRQIREPTFLLPPEWDAPFRDIKAADAFYKPAEEGRPSGYLVKGVLQPKGLDKFPSLPSSGKAPPIVLTRKDYPWLAADECFIVSEITFDQLAGNEKWLQYSSTLELIRARRNPSLALGADVAVSIHGRLLQPLLDMTLFFLGLPLILRRGNRNVFFAVGLCVAVVVGFMILVAAAQYLGSSYLIPPDLAAWLPLILFAPAAMYLSEPLRE